MTDELRRVLLVEDSAKDVELTLEALGEHRLANEVIVARDGVEGWTYLTRTGAFDHEVLLRRRFEG